MTKIFDAHEPLIIPLPPVKDWGICKELQEISL